MEGFIPKFAVLDEIFRQKNFQQFEKIKFREGDFPCHDASAKKWENRVYPFALAALQLLC